MPKLAIIMNIILIIALLVSRMSHAEEVFLKTPNDSKAGHYIKELLTLSYNKLGHNISWIENVNRRELELVAKGPLSGALARARIIESKYPELIRVPVPILKFSMLKVSDRARCGYCLDSQINSIAYVKGNIIAESYADKLREDIKRFPLSSNKNIHELVLKRRVDTLIVMDFQVPPEVYLNPYILITPVNKELDYHYLAPTHQHLKAPLEKVFNEFSQDGTLAKLAKKYQLNSFEKKIKPSTVIKAVSGNWVGYTNSDGTGVYWDIINAIFNVQDIQTQEYTWQRALNLFKNKKADILVGAYISEQTGEYLFSSYHIDYEYPLYAFAKTQTMIDKFTSKATDISACTDAGSMIEKYVAFLPKANIFKTGIEQCKMLFSKGKVDIVIDYDYNLGTAFKQLPKATLKQAEPLFLVFHNTPSGRYLKALFDHSISTMADEGTLKPFYLTDENFEQANIKW